LHSLFKRRIPSEPTNAIQRGKGICQRRKRKFKNGTKEEIPDSDEMAAPGSEL